MFQKLRQIGPGAMVAAAFIGPGTVTTATIAGAGFGFTLLWAVLFSTIATFVLQEMAARLGIVGQLGLGEALRSKCSGKLQLAIVSALVLGAVLLGNAAYEAGNISGAVLGFDHFNSLWSGWSFNPLVLIIGALAFYILYQGSYLVIEKTLVALVSLMGIVFVITAIMLRPDFTSIISGLFTPHIPENSLYMVIGLVGTTVVPYNLFLHASSVKKRWASIEDLANSRWDTAISVFTGGLITMAILICAAVAFEGTSGQVTSASDLALQLRPLLGPLAVPFISLGFLAAGLSSAVTAPLAAAFATSEMLGWASTITGKRFRIVWVFVLVSGLVFSVLGFSPTSIIFFAQVANGLLLPIVAGFLLWTMNDQRIMREYANNKWVNTAGLIIILVTIALSVRGISLAINNL